MDNSQSLKELFSDNSMGEQLQKPYNAMDIANYVVKKAKDNNKKITNLLLLKILYYLQAKFLVDTENVLFSEKIEKWGYGPVVPEVYSYFKDFGSSPIEHPMSYAIHDNDTFKVVTPANRNLKQEDIIQIDEIVTVLFSKYENEPFKLVERTHEEPMWINDKESIIKGNRHIEYDINEMKKYFENDEHWPW